MFPFNPWGGERPKNPYGGGGLLAGNAGEPLSTVPVIDPQRYGEINVANVNLTGAPGQVALPSSPTLRTLLVIQNTGLTRVWVNFGDAASVQNGILLAAGTATEPGGSVFFDAMVPQNQVFALSVSAAGSISVVYCDKRI